MVLSKKHGLNISDDAKLLKLASESFSDGDFICPECGETIFEYISDTHVECDTCGHVLLNTYKNF